MAIAPEHELVAQLTTPEQKSDIDNYITLTKKKSELDRMADVKTVSGAFTGSYVINPINGAKVPVWIADYVLAGYGTGAVMAVPSGDQRDYLFAKRFGLPIIQILDAQVIDQEADPTKEGKYINSGIIDGLTYKEATLTITQELERLNAGYAKINYRMRDAIFGRQRYWGEPVPVYFKDGLPYLIAESELPLLLPEVDKYLPTESGEPPLGRAADWKYKNQYEYELSTMPGWAGSSWYWFRYMDAKNEGEFASKDAISYWKDVDLYIGGSEHATGHLLYSRFWNKFMKDRGWVMKEEPFKKLINQGMIQGRSNFVYRLVKSDTFISKNVFIKFIEASIKIKKGEIVEQFEGLDINELYQNNIYQEEDLTSPETWGNIVYQENRVEIDFVKNDILNEELFIKRYPYYKDSRFIKENGKYICGSEVEKMSKSKLNSIIPDKLITEYGADTLRLYEMFLGPLEQSKPWNTNGIEGVFKFLRKFWKLFHDDEFNFSISNETPSKEEFKALHKIIKKAEIDVERFSFNTSVSNFMICVNELTALKCNKKEILQPLVIVLAPYSPHICEELWELCGNEMGSLTKASFPVFKPEYLVESEFNYPISINGKVKTNLNFSLDLSNEEVEKSVLASAEIQKYLEGKPPKKVIVVKGKIVNVVI